jgi:hypothetical protein
MTKERKPKRDSMFCVVAESYLELGQNLVELFGRLGRGIHGAAAVACAALTVILAGTFL